MARKGAKRQLSFAPAAEKKVVVVGDTVPKTNTFLHCVFSKAPATEKKKVVGSWCEWQFPRGGVAACELATATTQVAQKATNSASDKWRTGHQLASSAQSVS